MKLLRTLFSVPLLLAVVMVLSLAAYASPHRSEPGLNTAVARAGPVLVRTFRTEMNAINSFDNVRETYNVAALRPPIELTNSYHSPFIRTSARDAYARRIARAVGFNRRE